MTKAQLNGSQKKLRGPKEIGHGAWPVDMKKSTKNVSLLSLH